MRDANDRKLLLITGVGPVPVGEDAASAYIRALDEALADRFDGYRAHLAAAPLAAHTRRTYAVTFLIEPHEDIVRLTVTHENLPNHDMRGGIAHGWPAVMANLKSLLETGTVLPQSPWEMPRVDVSTR